ncbi:MAG: alpha/beta hydrolase [Verrucomicrobia bacterium]|nr:alpha/beta hydrolase [Verrucomicrobiota bacterium]
MNTPATSSRVTADAASRPRSARFRANLIQALAGLVTTGVLLHADPGAPVPLWPDGAPGALGTEAKDIPTLTPYLADPGTAGGAAIVVCPGGGYGGLAAHEGHDYALWLNQHGVTALVLKYRLGSHGYRHPIMLGDAARAVRLARARAADWGISPRRVGIMGSSAGGHLASTLLTHFDAGQRDAADPVERQSSRPDLGILCYAVITLSTYTHQGSKNNLLGKDPPEALVKLLSNELQVTAQTPPCFVWHTFEDTAVPVENSLQFAAALRRAGVPFDLHVYQKGRHGIGLAAKPPFENPHPWAGDCLFWLGEQGFLKRP